MEDYFIKEIKEQKKEIKQVNTFGLINNLKDLKNYVDSLEKKFNRPVFLSLTFYESIRELEYYYNLKNRVICVGTEDGINEKIKKIKSNINKTILKYNVEMESRLNRLNKSYSKYQSDKNITKIVIFCFLLIVIIMLMYC